MAGGLDHQEHQSSLKLYSDGYSRNQLSPEACVASHYNLVATGDDLLWNFWEIEESIKHESCVRRATL